MPKKEVEMNAADAIQAIESLATSISTSTAGASFQSPITAEDIQSFVDSIRSSADKIRSLSRAFVASGVIRDFIFFPKLPFEIRTAIWREALLPRVVELCLSYEKTHPKFRGERIRMCGPPPALMHVCQESRKLALEKYSFAFTDGEVTSSFAGIRVDPVEDTIYIPFYERLTAGNTRHLLHRGPSPYKALTYVQSIAVDAKMWTQRDPSYLGIDPIRFCLPNLKQFTIMIRESDGFDESHGTLLSAGRCTQLPESLILCSLVVGLWKNILMGCIRAREGACHPF
jgi:hypothetical protein